MSPAQPNALHQPFASEYVAHLGYEAPSTRPHPSQAQNPSTFTVSLHTRVQDSIICTRIRLILLVLRLPHGLPEVAEWIHSLKLIANVRRLVGILAHHLHNSSFRVLQ